ncbi:MAG TPA: TonB-dependent receptor plug domain-containing protein, partial [Steroidobacteraceae bacterium]
MRSKVAMIISSLLLAGAAAQPSLAQDDRPRLEEIIVTAERRAVDIQKTPLSVVALTGDQLEASTIQSTIDLQYRTTGFVFKTNTVLGQPYIRGVGSDIISAGADASVATFVDDVYQARAVASIQEFYDLER